MKLELERSHHRFKAQYNYERDVLNFSSQCNADIKFCLRLWSIYAIMTVLSLSLFTDMRISIEKALFALILQEEACDFFEGVYLYLSNT